MPPFKLRVKLQETFHDGLRKSPFRLSASDKLGDIDFKEHLIVVFWALEFQFFLFSHPTNTYFDKGKVTLELDQTVEAIEDAARKHVLDVAWLAAGTDVRFIRVMEVFEFKVPLESSLTTCSRGSPSSKNIDKNLVN
jgi:hypothetical protein